MAKGTLKVIFKPGGYEAYKDQAPITKPNWRVIASMVAVIFACGVIFALVSFLAIPRFIPKKSNVQNPVAIEDIVQDTVTVESAYQVLVSDPLPTVPPSPSATHTMEPTVDLEATMLFVSHQLEVLQSQTPVPTSTGLPTQTPPPTIAAAETLEVEPTVHYDQYAIVNVDCVVIREAPGREFNALDSACRGAEFPVIETYGQWTRVYHPAHQTAWIATWLLRIEDR